MGICNPSRFDRLSLELEFEVNEFVNCLEAREGKNQGEFSSNISENNIYVPSWRLMKIIERMADFQVNNGYEEITRIKASNLTRWNRAYFSIDDQIEENILFNDILKHVLHSIQGGSIVEDFSQEIKERITENYSIFEKNQIAHKKQEFENAQNDSNSKKQDYTKYLQNIDNNQGSMEEHKS